MCSLSQVLSSFPNDRQLLFFYTSIRFRTHTGSRQQPLPLDTKLPKIYLAHFGLMLICVMWHFGIGRRLLFIFVWSAASFLMSN